ncbi:MAG: DUF6265 family protein [Bacteroidota bacterium]
MKKITLLFSLLLVSNLLIGQSSKDFKWLTGTWQRTNSKPGTDSFESWAFQKSKMEGIGVTLKNGDTTFVENLRIINENGTWNYVAEVAHNETPTYFKIVSISRKRFVCANPDHDFPKEIEYERTDSGMKVTISGDGKAIPFVFRKTDG